MEVNPQELDDKIKYISKAITLFCVRNSLEDVHAGIMPSSKTGDFSDVKVVTPYGEIPWNDLSRINQEEIKELNIEITNCVYTFLKNLYANNQYEETWLNRIPDYWQDPVIDEDIQAMFDY
ncbi:hypothetical protein MASR1M48_17140 [Lactococcus petauri]